MKKIGLFLVILGFGLDARAREHCEITTDQHGTCTVEAVGDEPGGRTLCRGVKCECSVSSSNEITAHCSGRLIILNDVTEKVPSGTEVKPSAPTAVEAKE